jgi:glutathione S-transferase
MASPHTRLITIPVSHYCEKARWALDHLGIPYRETAVMPPFHRKATARVGGTQVPVLRVGTQTVSDSDAILNYLDQLHPGELYPAAPNARASDVLASATRINALSNTILGVEVRRWAYSYILTRDLLYPLWTQGVPAWQKMLFPVVFSSIKPRLESMIGVTQTSGPEAYGKVIGVFDEIATTLSDGRRYLLGDAFSAADITFAALAAPIVAPTEHPFPPLPRAALPARMVADMDAARATIAGQFALRVYRDHRRPRATPR